MRHRSRTAQISNFTDPSEYIERRLHDLENRVQELEDELAENEENLEDELKAEFREAVLGKVLVDGNMENPSHAKTLDPITSNSPLIGIGIVAANLGATEFTFDPEDDYDAAVIIFQKDETPVWKTILKQEVPCASYYFESLNGFMVCCRYTQGDLDVEVDEFGQGPGHQVNFQDPKHRKFLEACLEYFRDEGWEAAERLEALLEENPQE